MRDAPHPVGGDAQQPRLVRVVDQRPIVGEEAADHVPRGVSDRRVAVGEADGDEAGVRLEVGADAHQGDLGPVPEVEGGVDALLVDQGPLERRRDERRGVEVAGVPWRVTAQRLVISFAWNQGRSSAPPPSAGTTTTPGRASS